MARGILQTGKQLSSGHAITDNVSMDFDTQQHWGKRKINLKPTAFIQLKKKKEKKEKLQQKSLHLHNKSCPVKFCLNFWYKVHKQQMQAE